MNFIKSIFSWLGRFLEKARMILLNLGTAIVLIFITVAILGIFSSSEEEIDPAGKVLIFNPQGIVVDQEVFNSDAGFPGIFNENAEQIQIRDLLGLIEKIKADEDIAAVLLDFSNTGFAGPTTLLTVTDAVHSLPDLVKKLLFIKTECLLPILCYLLQLMRYGFINLALSISLELVVIQITIKGC